MHGIQAERKEVEGDVSPMRGWKDSKTGRPTNIGLYWTVLTVLIVLGELTVLTELGEFQVPNFERNYWSPSLSVWEKSKKKGKKICWKRNEIMPRELPNSSIR